MKVKITDNIIISINPEGYIFCGTFIFLTTISLFVTGLHTLTLIFFICSYLTLLFFRDPERVIPVDKNIMVSPSDGIIVKISTSKLPSELENDDDNDYNKITIFSNPINVQIQRIPLNATVERIEYINSLSVNAKADSTNINSEKNIILLREQKNQDKICIVQIANLIPKRIVSSLKINDECLIGDKYGMIKFGMSYVEIYFPKKYKIQVLKGQSMIAGETILSLID